MTETDPSAETAAPAIADASATSAPAGTPAVSSTPAETLSAAPAETPAASPVVAAIPESPAATKAEDVPAPVVAAPAEAQASPPVQAETAGVVDARLDRIEKLLGELQSKAKKDEPAKSKTVLALIFGALGAKLGWVGGHITGSIWEIPKNLKRAGREGVKEYVETVASMGLWHGWKSFEIAPISLALGATLGTLGAIVAATIGWKRGDRIHKPEDIVFHPINSFKRLFGPAPLPETQIRIDDTLPPLNIAAPQPQADRAQPGIPTTVAGVQHEGTVSAGLRQQTV
ncbi:MAG: hypothetical protein WDN72_08695 [Alphaproteobacteria bacterium]